MFQNGNGDWLSELPSVIKKHNNTIRSSTKLTPNQAFIKNNEKLVHNNLKYDRKKQTPIFHLGQLVRTADIKKVFSKGDSTTWSNILYTITEVIHDTKHSYRINYLPEKYSENLLRPTNLTLEETDQLMKKMNLIQ